MRLLLSLFLALLLNACAGLQLRGTGDLGLVIERASGQVTLVDTSSRQAYARIGGLGDLSHASAVYSRDGRYAFIFGRDGGLTKIDLLEARIVKRVMQSGNAIGGSISQDGRIVVAHVAGIVKAGKDEAFRQLPAQFQIPQHAAVTAPLAARIGTHTTRTAEIELLRRIQRVARLLPR